MFSVYIYHDIIVNQIFSDIIFNQNIYQNVIFDQNIYQI